MQRRARCCAMQQTLAGRVLIGAFWRIGAFLRTEVRALARGQNNALGRVARAPAVVRAGDRVAQVCVRHAAVAVFPGDGGAGERASSSSAPSPSIVRAPTCAQRIAIVERSWILGPLFLFNNLHSLHHEAPLIPWYEYPQRYRMIRERLIAANGGLRVRQLLRCGAPLPVPCRTT